MLIHHWSHPTTPAGPGWDIVIDGAVELLTEKGFIARAALGEAETISVVVDDPDGTLDFKRLHRWYMVEDETDGEQLVWNGYIGDQHILRGDSGETIFPTGTGRRWHLEVIQENTLLGFRAIWDTDGKRPKESPGERLTWLLGSRYLSTVIDHGLIDWGALNAFPDMDKVDYRPQFAADVLRDISLVTGYNHYCRYRDASSDIELAFYAPNTSDLDSSSLQISNDPADLDPDADFASNSTYPPLNEPQYAQLDRKGDKVAAGMVLPWAKGFRYDYRLATSYEFGFIDQVAPAGNIKTAAAADRLLRRLLAQHASQDERVVNVPIQLEAANLNDVRHGQRIQAKFVHLPGWENLRWARVVSKSFSRPENQAQTRYDVDLELSPQIQISCSPDSVTSIFESESPHVDDVTPFVVSIPGAPDPSIPSVLVALTMITKGDGGIFGGDGSNDMTVDAPWTLLARRSASGYQHENTSVAYLADPGGADLYVNWPAPTDPTTGASLETIAVAIQTTSTAPVQVADGVGPTLTLPGAPTLGNVLLRCSTNFELPYETIGANPPSPVWTPVKIFTMPDLSPFVIASYMGIWMRCVGPDDDGSYTVGLGSQNWSSISEWAT